MSDQCGSCTLKGNLKKCKETLCHQHENWYAVEQQKVIDRLEEQLNQCPLLIDSSLISKGWMERVNGSWSHPDFRKKGEAMTQFTWMEAVTIQLDRATNEGDS
jgi:hypothetical protein